MIGLTACCRMKTAWLRGGLLNCRCFTALGATYGLGCSPRSPSCGSWGQALVLFFFRVEVCSSHLCSLRTATIQPDNWLLSATFSLGLQKLPMSTTCSRLHPRAMIGAIHHKDSAGIQNEFRTFLGNYWVAFRLSVVRKFTPRCSLHSSTWVRKFVQHQKTFPNYPMLNSVCASDCICPHFTPIEHLLGNWTALTPLIFCYRERLATFTIGSNQLDCLALLVFFLYLLQYYLH